MSWKRLLSAGFVACILVTPALAQPSIIVKPRPAVAGRGGIEWEVFVQTNDANYLGSLSVELPITLAPHVSTPVFNSTLAGAGGDDTNGTTTTTWYYNQTGPGGADPILWNTTDPPVATDHTQTVGANPFAGGADAEGLVIDTVGETIFAALGSTVSLPDALGSLPGKQVRLMHIFTTDGILSWSNAIIGENGVQYSGISGSSSSILPGDMDANGNFVATTGAAQNPTTNADIPGFLQALGAPGSGGCAAYNATRPGLNCEKRGDTDGSIAGNTTNADIPGFLALLMDPVNGAGAGGEVLGNSVPEPTSLALLLVGSCMVGVRRRRR
jgi:hypothetical protein